jgi:ketosteroid isomerase-like protein
MNASTIRFDRNIIDTWVSFWNTYDLSMVDKLFLREVSYFSSEKQGLIKGIDALRKHHEGFGFVPGGKPSQNRLWLEAIDVADHGPAVILAAIWGFQRAGADKAQKGPVTLVYAQTADGYRIAHANFGNYA